MFRKQLSGVQWVSLLILTVGCMIHAGGSGADAGAGSVHGGGSMLQLGLGCVFILIQVLCSVFAGVYNEYIIKGAGADIHIMVQNVFMYLDSIVCNIALLSVKVTMMRRTTFRGNCTILFQGDISSAFTLPALDSIRQPLVLLLIINNSVLGIVTSLFLKKLNSILKAFASALELVVTAVLSVPVLGIPLNLHTVLALGLISVAVVMYARNPVTSQTEHQDKSRSDDAGNKV